MDTIEKFLNYKLIDIGQYVLSVNTLLSIVFIILLTKIIIWLIKKALYKARKFEKLDHGNLLALFQIIKYVLWIIAISIIMNTPTNCMLAVQHATNIAFTEHVDFLSRNCFTILYRCLRLMLCH